MATTYILRCADNKLYVGSTTNLEERLKRHNAGYASEFTHVHKPVALVYKEEYDTYQQAFKRERQLKKWSLAKKKRWLLAILKGSRSYQNQSSIF